MTKLEVFDPAMCCSTGVCGPSVDPALPRFAADLEWLQAQGVVIERFNLSQEPAAFVARPAIREALSVQGNACLPLILVNNQIASRGEYLTRDALARLVGLGEETASPLKNASSSSRSMAVLPVQSCCDPKDAGKPGCC
jgi:hypothetical protein